MNTKSENKLAMFQSVIGVCEANSASWQNLKAFADSYATFKEHVGNIEDLSPAQATTASGNAEDKRRARAEMATIAYEIGSAVSSYAVLQNDNVLLASVNFSFTDLSSGTGKESADRAQSIYDAAKSVVANLGDYDITAADLKELADAIKEFRTASPKPRQARIRRKTATAQVDQEIRAADAVLKDHLDALLPKLRKTAQEFAALYENARTIVDLAATRSAKEPVPTPASPTP